MMSICEIWKSRAEQDWIRAVAGYWDLQSVKRNCEIERRMASLALERIRDMGAGEWKDFLREDYFPWKFSGNYLGKRLRNLEVNGLDHLFHVKKLIFELSHQDVGEAITLVRKIKGLGPAGASGLLTVLFPAHYGTADKFVVKSLALVYDLPERERVLRLLKVNARGRLDVVIDSQDAVLLIDIMRRKANELNSVFGSTDWTPRKVDMVLWSSREEPDIGTIKCIKH